MYETTQNVLKRKPLQLLSGEEWERNFGQAGVVDPAARPGAEFGPQSRGRTCSGLCPQRMLISASQERSSVISLVGRGVKQRQKAAGGMGWNVVTTPVLWPGQHQPKPCVPQD